MSEALALRVERTTLGERLHRAWLALRSETPVVGLDRPDERRVISPVAPSRWGTQRTRDEAVDADVQSTNVILSEANSGRTARFVDLCDSTMRERDSRLGAVGRTRVLTIQGRPWVMRPSPGYETDPEAKRVADFVTQAFDRVRDLEVLFGHLAYATLVGHACLEHQWFRDGDTWRTQPRWIHGNRFAWDTATERVGFTAAGWFGSTIPDSNFLDNYVDKFVFHNPVAGHSSYPWQRGAMRSRVLASVIKRLGIRFWIKMLERWGQPQVFVTKPPPSTAGGEVPQGDEDERILAMLRGLGSTWNGLVPHGATVETISANVVSDLHEKWVQYQNLEDAIAILGQNLSTEISQGGSYAAARTHALVRLDYLAADLAELTSTITDQWIRPLVFYNFGSSAPVPYIDWFLQPKGAWTVGDFNAGLCTADELRNTNGHDAEVGGTGGRYAKGVGPAGEVTSTEAPPIADVIRAIELAAKNNLRPTAESISAIGARLGLAFEAVPDGAPEPKAIPPSGADLNADPPSPDAATTTIEVGQVWIDTRDGHSLRVERLGDGKVYLVDLTAEPNAHGQREQFAWSVAAFRERCTPPAPSVE